MNIFQVDGLTFSYPLPESPALSDISLRIGSGEFVAVMGANNAGKTSLCLALAGVLPQLIHGKMQGRVSVCGPSGRMCDAASLSVADIAEQAALVMQRPEAQLSGARFTVFEEIAFGLENRGVPREEMALRVGEALALVGLEQEAQRSPSCLSGGQLQRVVLAAALAGEPRALVLDEPTTFLDPMSRQTLFALLRSLCDQGRTIVVTEQHMEPVAQFADRVLVMHEGRVVLDGPPAEVFASPMLRQTGLEPTRFGQVSELARAQGLWREGAPSSSTLEGVLTGLVPPLSKHEGPAGDARASVSPLISGNPHLRTENNVAKAEAERDSTPDTAPDTACSVARLTCWDLPEEKGVDASAYSDIRLDLHDLHFSYADGTQALRGVNLTIKAGECVALLGRNGSGKSTLVRHCNGLLRPEKGRVSINGQDSANRRVAQLARSVALLFQNPDDQICKGTVLEEVAFGPLNMGHERQTALGMAFEALADFGLDALEGVNPHDLGGSERKRLALASVFAMDTGIVLLDEPTAGLDPGEICQLEAVLRRMAAQGRIVVLISHDMDFVAENASRAVCLDSGEKCFDGSLVELFGSGELSAASGLVQPQMVRLSSACGLGTSFNSPQMFVEQYKKSPCIF